MRWSIDPTDEFVGVWIPHQRLIEIGRSFQDWNYRGNGRDLKSAERRPEMGCQRGRERPKTIGINLSPLTTSLCRTRYLLYSRF